MAILGAVTPSLDPLGKPINVLIADDSLTMRAFLADAVTSDPSIHVIATAKNGQDCIDKALQVKPDVILLDLEMPIMGGLDALNKIMDLYPTPIIIVSAYAREGAKATIQALENGAFDYVEKPASITDTYRIRDELIIKIRNAAQADIRKIKLIRDQCSTIVRLRKPLKPSKKADRVVIIGASTGGPQALFNIFRTIPPDFPSPVLVVQHMPKEFTKSFAERLNSVCGIRVKEAENGDEIIQGRALVAPGGYHMEVLSNGYRVRLKSTPPVNFVRPSVDVTMISAASAFKNSCIGVLLTGMGRDGADGMSKIVKVGGVTIAEDQSTSVVYGMPRAAVEIGAATKILPLDKIVPDIIKLTNSVPAKSSLKAAPLDTISSSKDATRTN